MRPGHLALSILGNRLGTVPRPSWCTYLVNYHCNARCKMCDSWRMRRGYELSPAEVAAVFKKIGRLDVVRLSGGEPFLREDMCELATAVMEQSSPGVLHITTNGSFPDRAVKFVENFKQPRKLRFMISFDGAEEEHDENRGKDVTFATALQTVGRLAGLRKKYGIAVSINHTVISERSLEDHGEIKRRFEAMDVDVHTVLAYSDSAMYGAKRFGKKAMDLIPETGYPLHPKLKNADVVGFVRRQLRDLQNVSDPILRVGKRYYLRGLLSRLKDEPHPSPQPKCVALRSHIRLLPDGSVPVCQFNTEKVGNLLNQTFEEVWLGQAGRESRQWVDDCPGCWAECEVMPSAIFSGDLLFNAAREYSQRGVSKKSPEGMTPGVSAAARSSPASSAKPNASPAGTGIETSAIEHSAIEHSAIEHSAIEHSAIEHSVSERSASETSASETSARATSEVSPKSSTRRFLPVQLTTLQPVAGDSEHARETTTATPASAIR